MCVISINQGFDNYLRVTIGTDEEMDALLAFFRDYLRKKA